MHHKMTLLTIAFTSLAFLNGYAGETTQKVVNEYYSPGKKTPHTLFPKHRETPQIVPVASEKKHPKLSPIVKHIETNIISEKKHPRLTETPKHINRDIIHVQLAIPEKPVKAMTHQDIVDILSKVKVVKTDAVEDILHSIKVIKAVKPISGDEIPQAPTLIVDIAKAKAVSTIAKSVAFVESAKAVAKANIAQAVTDIQLAHLQEANQSITHKDVHKAKLDSARKVAQAVATTEIAKAKAAAKIAKNVAKVEQAKAQKLSKTH